MSPRSEKERITLLWNALARMHGYNEMAKKASSLGERIFCRLARDAACETATALGASITCMRPGPILITLEAAARPRIDLYESDIELMREAVHKFDAARADATAHSEDGRSAARGGPLTQSVRPEVEIVDSDLEGER